MPNPHQSVKRTSPGGWADIRLDLRWVRPVTPIRPKVRPWCEPRAVGLLDNQEEASSLERMADARAFALDRSGPDGEKLTRAMLPHRPLDHLKFTIASPLAMRVARDRIIAAALPVLEGVIERKPLWFTTVILPGWYYPVGMLWKADAADIKEALRQKIRRLEAKFPEREGGMLIGTLEVSLRTDVHGQPAGWQVHLHAIADSNMNFLLKKLRKTQFGIGPEHVRTPVMPVRVSADRLARYIGYTFKFQARRQDAACSKSTGQCGPAFPHELPSDVAPEALLWLDRCALSDIVLVIGTKALRTSLKMQWCGPKRPVHMRAGRVRATSRKPLTNPSNK